MEKRIQRLYECELRAENDEQNGDHLEGRPIVYGAETIIAGRFKEVIDRGALDEADLTDVAFLVNHDNEMIPLARSRRNNINSTMQMMIDSEGMAIRVNLDTENNMVSKSLYSATKRKDVSGMSFAFLVDGEEWTDLDSDMPTRHIRSIKKVFEVSACTFPAYNQTVLEARTAESLENDLAALERAKAAERDVNLRNEIKALIAGGQNNAD